MQKESKFQSDLIKELHDILGTDGYVFKLDCRQGIPDLLILYKSKWATLECKRSADASRQPNQDYHVSKMNGLSFSRFIFPENKEEELCETLGLGG